MRHRPKMKIGPIPKNLDFEWEGGQWSYDHPDLWRKLDGKSYFTYEEVEEVRDGLDTAIIGMEAVKSGASFEFEEARNLNAALRSGRALLAKLDAWLFANK